MVLQQALADLNTAYRNFFASISGQRKGPKVAPPRFRSRKDNRQSIRFTRNSRFKVLDNGRLRLPKIGEVRVRWSRPLPAAPSSVTVVRDAAGRYFASFVVQTGQEETLPPSEGEVGIDLGLTHFAVLSDGTKVAAPRFLPSTRRCSACGRVNQKMALDVRVWGCPCGATHDRDVNAALNILAAGQAESRNDRGARVRPPAMAAPCGEAVTHPDAAPTTRSVEGISVL